MANTLYLRSNNSSDIRAVVDLGYWTNTVRSSKVRVGDKVVIFANKGVCKKEKVAFADQMVAVGTLTQLPYHLDAADTNWPSSRAGTYLRYFVRFDLKDIEMKRLGDIEGAVARLDPLRGHLTGGKYVVA